MLIRSLLFVLTGGMMWHSSGVEINSTSTHRNQLHKLKTDIYFLQMKSIITKRDCERLILMSNHVNNENYWLGSFCDEF